MWLNNLSFKSGSMSNQWLILFFLVGAIFVGLVLIFSGIVAPKSTNPQKFDPYECGIPTEGVTWLQFNIGYYLFAILFLVFDVETVLVFPWAVVMKEVGIAAFIEIVIFFLIAFRSSSAHSWPDFFL